jgi:hypothetical protein
MPAYLHKKYVQVCDYKPGNNFPGLCFELSIISSSDNLYHFTLITMITIHINLVETRNFASLHRLYLYQSFCEMVLRYINLQ